MLRKIALHRRGLLGGVLSAVLLISIAGCGTVAAPSTPTPLPTVVPTEVPPTDTAVAVPTDTTAPSQPPASEVPTEATSPAVTDTSLPAASPTSAQEQPTVFPVGNLQWTQVGLKGSNVTSLAMSDQGGGAVVLAAGPDGVWRSAYNFTRWDKLSVPLNVSGRFASVAMGSTDVMYTVTSAGCASGGPSARARSTDGGQTWTAMQGEAMAIAAANATIAYATTCNNVIKTTDAGSTWTQLSASVTNYDPNAIAVSPDGQTVFVSYVSEGGTGQMRMSKDAGATWSDITPKNPQSGEFTAPADLTYVAALEGRPQDGGLYMTSAQGIWFLPADSTSWQFTPLQPAPGEPAGANGSYTAFLVDTAYSAAFYKPGPVLYVARAMPGSQGGAQSLGVLRSLDLGKTWETVGQGLGQRVVNSLVLVVAEPSGGSRVETLLAATSDGIWAVSMQAR